MPESIESTLTSVFHDVFDDDGIEFRPELTASDVDGWDSLTHIRLILTVERTFGIKFTASEVGSLKNAGDLMQLVQNKVSSKS